MSDRDGIVLYAESPVGLATVLISVMTVLLCVLAVGVTYPPLLASAYVGGALLLPFALLARTKLVFRAQWLERRWLFRTRVIRFAEIASFALDDDGISIALRGGDIVRLWFRLRASPSDQAEHRRTARDATGHMLTTVTGLIPKSGRIERVGGNEVPLVTPPKVGERLRDTLATASRTAQLLGRNELTVGDFVEATVHGGDRPLLLRAGLDPTAFPRRDVEGYRGSEPYAPNPELEEALQAATFRAVQSGKAEIHPIDVLLEIFRAGGDEAHSLIVAGLTPIRLLDALAHDLSIEESDARAYGTLTPEELIAGLGPDEQATIVVHNDDFTPYVVVARLLERHVFLQRAEADRFARRVHDEGRAVIAGYRAKQAAAIAIDVMREARRAGAVIRVTVERATG